MQLDRGVVDVSGLRLDSLSTVYNQKHFNREIYEEMKDRDGFLLRDEASLLKQSIQYGDLAGKENADQGKKKKNDKTFSDEVLVEMVNGMMKEIPGDAQWIDTRFYHEFTIGSRFWVSIDFSFHTETKGPVCVIFYLVNEDGVVSKEPDVLGMCTNYQDLSGSTMNTKFEANQKFIKSSDITENSFLAIQLKEILFDKQGKMVLKSIGFAIIMVMNGEYFSNGYFQLPLMRGEVDVKEIANYILGRPNDMDPTEALEGMYIQYKENKRVIKNSSIFFWMMEEAFNVVSYNISTTIRRICRKRR